MPFFSKKLIRRIFFFFLFFFSPFILLYYTLSVSLCLSLSTSRLSCLLKNVLLLSLQSYLNQVQFLISTGSYYSFVSAQVSVL